MNYKKGFFRITLIISIVSVIIGLFYGINKFSSYYSRYEGHLEIHKSYFSSMFKLLNEDIDTSKTTSLLMKSNKLRDEPTGKIRGLSEGNNIIEGRLIVPLDKRLGLVPDASNYSEEKKFKIKKTLINNNSLESTIDGEYISIKRLMDAGINKKLEESIKNKIGDEYANANISILFPWKEVIIYILLLPLFFGSLIWIIYYTVKFIVAGFQN